jgi:hypothetical protein
MKINPRKLWRFIMAGPSDLTQQLFTEVYQNQQTATEKDGAADTADTELVSANQKVVNAHKERADAHAELTNKYKQLVSSLAADLGLSLEAQQQMMKKQPQSQTTS